MKTVTVVGLGYVGLPLVCLLVDKGYKVYGLDVDENKVQLTNQGISHIKDEILESGVSKIKGKIIATTDAKEAISNSDIIVVCVPTPVDDLHKPDLGALKSASTTISKYLKDGQLVVIESTIAPGTCREVVKPILDENGNGYHLAHCPERVDPGNKQFQLENLPRVLGAISEDAIELAYKFYNDIIDAEVCKLSSIEAAEATKIVENSFRDINIAFVNELAMSFDKLGIDVLEVIKGASTKP
ncbi:nucleotide sugar dehydrogenase, partial [Nanoarchaeota archaeon]